MKPVARLTAALAAGLAVLLASAAPSPPTAPTAAPATTTAPETTREIVALGATAAAVLDLPTTATTAPAPTTTTAPPPTNACPVAGPSEFVDSWGFRRAGHRHQGVDMLAAEGTPAVAPVAGFVTFRDNSVGGLSYHLVADDGTYYYGTHLSAYGTEGRVEAGTVIGFVGDTGNARGTPHLHFEVHPGGEGSPAVDPYPTVALLCGA